MLVEGAEVTTPVSKLTVRGLISEGGQGWVYRVTDERDSPCALKWYKPGPSRPLRDDIEYLVDRGEPDDRFVWPSAVVDLPGSDTWGYVMPLIPSGYHDLVALLHGTAATGEPVDPSFEATITMCHQLARSFLRLHAMGLCYRDISSRNIFFEEVSGDVLICDNDNVGVDGTRGAVLGTSGFMAPEVVRLEDRMTTLPTAPPSATTDLHSLAVALFQILVLGHPLEGAKSDTAALDRAWYLDHYGNDPLFIFDPDDDRNRPVTDTPERYWRAYPQFVRDLFTTAFTEGLVDPDARVREAVWAKAMLRLRDCLWRCPTCEGAVFFDADAPDRPCAHVDCGRRPEVIPNRLRLDRRDLVLAPGNRLMTDHIGLGDSSEPTGVVNHHPSDPGRLGLENLTETSWTLTTRSGSVHTVPAGRTAEVAPGNRIHFGRAEGVVI